MEYGLSCKKQNNVFDFDNRKKIELVSGDVKNASQI